MSELKHFGGKKQAVVMFADIATVLADAATDDFFVCRCKELGSAWPYFSQKIC
jgi:hypothetical protein